MGGGLFNFIFNTLWKRLNDPHNTKYWVPKLLQQADKPGGDGGKLVPLQESFYDLGQVTGEPGVTFRNNIMGQWWQAVPYQYKAPGTKVNTKLKNEQFAHQPIPCPDQPWPQLAISDLTIYGLDNVWVQPDPVVTQTGTGYRAIITLQFGRYAELSQILVNGNYSLKQCACSAPATKVGEPVPTACDSWVPTEHVDGEGAFKMGLSNVRADVAMNIQIVGNDSNRALRLSIDQITVRGADPASLPGATVSDLTVKTEWAYLSNNVWLPQAKNALESADGRRGLMQNLNASLNQPGTREQFAKLFDNAINNGFNDALGGVPVGGLPGLTGQQAANPFDQYVFDRVRVALNNPASEHYLPKTIYGFNSPQLEPYLIDQISLGNQRSDELGLEFQDVRLLQVQVNGISNNQTPANQMIIKPENIDATMNLSQLNPPPQVNVGGASRQVPAPPLKVTGQFSMRSEDIGETLGGGFTLNLNRSNVATTLKLSGDELDDSGRGLRPLQITFQKLQLQAPLSEARINIKIDSEFGDIINQIFNQDDIKSKAVQGVNDKAAQSLGQISQTATENVRKIIASKLDG